jgi:hypothetical protein
MSQPGFDAAIEEFVRATEAMLGRESPEDLPPPPPAPLSQTGPPFESALVLDEDSIRKYAYSIGDDNPLFTDRDYGRDSHYGTQVAPGPVLVLARYPIDHGAVKPGGYPVANYVAGIALEHYDALHPGTRFVTSKVPKELFEKSGRSGRLLFLVSETLYWDSAGELKGNAYGSIILSPMETMASGRSMDLTRLGERMLYEREVHSYSDAEVAEISNTIMNEERRGADPLWWEDVVEGDRLPAIVQPPYTVEDEITYQFMRHGLTAATDGTRLLRAFGPAYRRGRVDPAWAREHPVTRWPYTPGEWDEHYDAFLSPFRGAPLPFDFGVQRAQIPQRLLSNWMGDPGFIRKMYMSFRLPLFYGDSAWFRGTVLKKHVLTEEGLTHKDSPPRAVAYHAVTIRIEGTNQRGEIQSSGFGTVYLPSREDGPPELPVPHEQRPAFVPFKTHTSVDWY